MARVPLSPSDPLRTSLNRVGSPLRVGTVPYSPGDPRNMADPNIQTTRRIPDTNTGGQYIGQALQNLGSSVSTAGRRLAASANAAAADADTARKQTIAFDDGVLLQKYTVDTANLQTSATNGANPDGSGAFENGVQIMDNAGQAIQQRIQTHISNGDIDLAQSLQKKYGTIRTRQSVALHQNEFNNRREYERNNLEQQSDIAIANTTVNAAENNAAVSGVQESIQNSVTLSPQEKALRSKTVEDGVTANEVLATRQTDVVGAKQDLGIDLSSDELAGGMIRQFEGSGSPALQAYEDPGAPGKWVIGDGSDHIYTADGRLVKVVPGMTIDRATADRTLRYRIGEFRDIASSAIGPEWNTLPREAQAVAISIAWNYGSLPEELVEPFKSGDRGRMAQAVRGLSAAYQNPNTRGGLTNRRNAEAEFIMSGQQGARVYDLTGFLTKGKSAEHAQFNQTFGPRLQDFLEAAQDAGHDIQIFSGYRSPERQKVLWENAVKKYGSPNAARMWVAPPGKSRHNSGTAADLSFGGTTFQKAGKMTPAQQAAQQWAHANAERYGLHFRMDHEPWHIEADPEARGANARYASIAPDIKAKVVKQVQTNRNTIESQRSTAAKAEHNAYKEDLTNRINSGDVTRLDDVADIWRLDAGERSAFEKVIADRNEELRLEGDAVQGYQSGAGMPYTTKKQKDVADALVESATQGDFWQNPMTTALTVHRANVMPRGRIAEARTALERGDAQRIAQYMPTLTAVYQNSPQVLDGDGNGHLVGSVEQYRSLISGGASHQEASAAVAARYHPDNRKEYDRLVKDSKDVIEKHSTPDVFYHDKVGLLDDTWGTDPGTDMFVHERQRAEVMNRWQATLTQAIWETQGDEDAALALAGRRFSRIFGETSIDGQRRVQTFPVEQNYPVLFDPQTGETNHNYIIEQARADVAASEQNPRIDLTTVRILPGRYTQASIDKGGPAKYTLWYEDPDTGMWEMAGASGAEETWHVDVGAARARAQEAQGAAADRAQQFPMIYDRRIGGVRSLTPQERGLPTRKQDERTFPPSIDQNSQPMRDIRESVPSLAPQGAQ